MGQAIVKGLLQKGIFKPNQNFVFDPAEDKKKDAENLNVQIVDHSEELLENAHSLLIADRQKIIQPQFKELGYKIDQQVLIISIAREILSIL
jgi:pyrroline-5-carboxylate reductase